MLSAVERLKSYFTRFVKLSTVLVVKPNPYVMEQPNNLELYPPLPLFLFF